MNGISNKMVGILLVLGGWGIVLIILGAIVIKKAPQVPKSGKKDPEWRRKTIERGRAHRNGIIMISVGLLLLILCYFMPKWLRGVTN